MKLQNGGIVVDIPEKEAEQFLRGGYKRVDGKPSSVKPEVPVEAPVEDGQPPKHSGGIFNRGGGNG
jgi:hypothetical protein